MTETIVFIGSFTYPKGMAGTKRIHNFIEYFLKNNFQVGVLINSDKKGNIKSNNKLLLHIPKYSQNIFLKIIQYHYHLITSFGKLTQWKKDNNYLYVYNGLSYENILLVYYAKLIGYNIIIDYVEDFSLCNEETTFIRKIKNKSTIILEKIAKIMCDGIVIISFHLKEKFEVILENTKPIVLIPPTANSNCTKINDSSHEKFIFAYSGTYGKKDDISNLISSFDIVKNIYCEAELHLLGTCNDLVLLDTIKLVPGIVYLGYLEDDDFYEYICKCVDALCMTRTDSAYANAGFPFKLGEYLATGNPVIASNVSDIGRYLTNMVDCILVSPNNKKELIKGMSYLLENRKRAKEIGEKGKAIYEKHFDIEMNGKKLYNFLSSIS